MFKSLFNLFSLDSNFTKLKAMFKNKAAYKVRITPENFGSDFRVLVRPLGFKTSDEAYVPVDAVLEYDNANIVRKVKIGG